MRLELPERDVEMFATMLIAGMDEAHDLGKLAHEHNHYAAQEFATEAMNVYGIVILQIEAEKIK